MAIPKVLTKQQNMLAGGSPSIEGRALFIGVANGSNINTLVPITSSSDFDDLMGTADSALKAQVEAFALNAGPGFTAAFIECETFADWPAALEVAMETFSPEMVGVCLPVGAAQDLSDAQTVALEQINKYERLITLFMETPVITAGQTLADYVVSQAALTDGLALDRVVPVPNLNGNNVGALIGRLAKPDVSVADSPMRIKTGADTALGAFKVDSVGKAINLATLEALHMARLTVPIWLVDYDGVYWSDCLTLDATGGDFQIIENRRVIDKAARAIRSLTIPLIADRSFNDSETSTTYHESFLATPLRKMAKSATVNKKKIPGDIKEPADDAITIQWVDKFKVKIFYKITPFNSPKEIVNNLFLNLATDS